MTATIEGQWPAWRKIAFRFMFIYLALQITPWTWLNEIPGVGYVTQFYYLSWNWLVGMANAKLFHIATVLVPKNGSGDTSFGWAELYLTILLAFIGCIIWSLLDFTRRNYTHLNYWLCLFVRYYIAMMAFIYGIEKLFAMQMPFPNLHQLATPLGDLLPMRFSWMFVGYSPVYQVFSGLMETVAGVLLLYRRTTTLGIFVATGVFINVMMLNLSYDIPVKIFSMQLVVDCLFLLANEGDRLIRLLVLNKPVAESQTYHYNFSKKWARCTRIALKILFIVVAIGLQFYYNFNYYSESHKTPGKQPVKNGIYAVTVFNVNNQNVPLAYTDSLSWRDVIFEDGLGSVKTTDTSFRQRYKRGYFYYKADSATRSLQFRKQAADSLAFITLNYSTPDENTILLWGKQRNDSLHITLKRTNRHFQLAERQFHWLSEHNR